MSIWSAHLDWRTYGPDAAIRKLTTDPMQIMAGEMDLGSTSNGRAVNVGYIVTNEQFASALANSDTEPMILGGDFNTPSHLDRVESTRQDHFGWTFDWPGTKLFADEGLIDSYRELYPDPSKHPAITWSTVYKFLPDYGYSIPANQDRIDIIMYKSALLTPVTSGEYYGDEPIQYMPFHAKNDWPSDHTAFVSDFHVQFLN